MNAEFIIMLTDDIYGLQYAVYWSDVIEFDGTGTSSMEIVDKRLHNIYGVALMERYTDGSLRGEYYYINDLLHCDHKPAIIYYSKHKIETGCAWYNHGKYICGRLV